MNGIDLRLLGPPTAHVAGHQVDLGGPQQQAVLALLALHVGQMLRTDAIIDALWERDPPPRARTTVQTYISRLRHVLDRTTATPDGAGASQGRPTRDRETLRTVAGGYILAVPPQAVDAARFERLLYSGLRARSEGDLDGARAQLGAALGEWRGPALAGVTAGRLLAGEATRLDDLRLAALEARLDADLAAGDAAVVVCELEALCEAHPERERLHELHMLALYRCGRQTEALALYRRLQTTLVDELGVEPGPALRALHAAVLHHAPELSASGGPGPPLAPPLPVPPTAIVGRAQIVEHVVGRLVAGPLVTLVGTGGCGKTRLGLEVARRATGRHPEGVWLVELASVDQPAGVPGEVARALRVPVRQRLTATEALAESLAQRRMLVLLDNCEHVLDAAARLVGRLLATCPQLRVLATSRTALGADGESVVAVPPLAAPDGPLELPTADRYPAVQLFCERAGAATPGFRLDVSNVAAVGRICAELDGIPLALELAAARLSALSPGQLADRLGDRFGVLGTTQRVVGRHRTLREAVAWSHGLLDARGQALFRRLAVLPGSFSLETAEAVGGASPLLGDEVAGVLADLVAQSVVEAVARGAEVRYRMLHTLRQYAAEQLADAGEEAVVQQRLATHLIAMTAPAFLGLRGPAHARWQDRLTVESASISAAMEWALGAGEAELACRLAANLCWFWARYGQAAQGGDWLERADAISARASPGPRAWVRSGVAFVASTQGDLVRAAASASSALELFQSIDDRLGVAFVQPFLAPAHLMTDPDHAAALLEEALVVQRATGDTMGTATTTNFLAHARRKQGRPDLADALFAGTQPTFDAFGDRWGTGWSLFGRALCALDSGEDARYPQALRWLDDSIAASRSIDHLLGLALAVAAQGLLAEAMSEPQRARDLLHASQDIGRKAGHDRLWLLEPEITAAFERLEPEPADARATGPTR